MVLRLVCRELLVLVWKNWFELDCHKVSLSVKKQRYYTWHIFVYLGNCRYCTFTQDGQIADEQVAINECVEFYESIKPGLKELFKGLRA